MDSQFSYFFRLSAVLEAMPDALVIVDSHARIILVNKQTEKLFGYERTELLGEFIEQLMPVRFRDRHQQHRNNYLATPRTRPMGAGLELFGLNKDGTEFPIEISLSPLKTDEGLMVLAAVRDITDRKQLENQLRTKNDELETQNRRVQEANRLKSEFLANMSHELRTPLNGIIGFAELMHSGRVGPISDEHKEYLGDILSSSRHLLQLINDVLDLAKIEAGKLEFHPEKVEVKKLVYEIRDILRTLIAQKRINLEIKIDPKVEQIIIDPSKFKQILYNYVSNAIKFTPEAGHVYININQDGEEKFRIEVKDSGIGIHTEDFPRLFTEFQQLDTSRAKKFQGTGLGLALTKRLVEAQGGTVGVESIFGKGSTFYAILPQCTPLNESPAEKISHKNTIAASANVPTVLVIEDDLKDQAVIVKLLKNAGYAVEVANNGKEALHLGHERRFDALILDLLLPDMNGLDVLQSLRAKGPNKDTPTIVTTVVAEKAISVGFRIHDFFVKPVDPSELLSSLKRSGVNPDNAKSILVIDDNLSDLKLAKTMLDKLGYRVTCETSGASGLQAVKRQKPDAIVLDLLMPGMDGFEFLNRFRKTKISREIPVIIWTVNDLDDTDKANLQAAAVVQKGDGSNLALLVELQRYLPLNYSIDELTKKMGKISKNKKTE
jgi:PAS domain S-box-containing protein